jgi:hypothetical protein
MSIGTHGVPPWVVVPIKNPPDELVTEHDKLTDVTLIKSCVVVAALTTVVDGVIDSEMT